MISGTSCVAGFPSGLRSHWNPSMIILVNPLPLSSNPFTAIHVAPGATPIEVPVKLETPPTIIPIVPVPCPSKSQGTAELSSQLEHLLATAQSAAFAGMGIRVIPAVSTTSPSAAHGWMGYLYPCIHICDNDILSRETQAPQARRIDFTNVPL